jgi:hypothetical protein
MPIKQLVIEQEGNPYRDVVLAVEKGVIWITCSEPGDWRDEDSISISVTPKQAQEIAEWLRKAAAISGRAAKGSKRETVRK